MGLTVAEKLIAASLVAGKMNKGERIGIGILDRAGGPVCSARHLPRSGTDRFRLTRPFGQW
jgi:hypothetical protein